ncbi:MAG: lysoplasmalogenase [Alphaproteobacteria bacterium]|nr:lysoplasmalogenase [Alphaproteobacteria bacterium]MBU1280877.1 lysoplasmalogenase [Alphaproteobacteria bacterium]MBU1572344.1 lysoplasmalogenase [Alphaproteobacteria bacterium]MBU1828963.1 lysoplasmalogenase [Alphaproteobacteria bacterium]MBU2079042.1 lysoplasmalogenase [Alphaproteobacteria bacterium]
MQFGIDLGGGTAVVVLVAILAALAYLPFTHRDKTLWHSVLKTMPVAVFAGSAAVQGAPGLLVAGLALSALGDWALSRSFERAFMAGLVSFALAHLCYLGLFIGLVETWRILPVIVLIGFALSSEHWLAPFTGHMRWPVRVYVGLICAMVAAALSLPDLFRLASIGALLFMASDLILALQMFRMSPDTKRAHWAGYALWALYILGQMTILFAFVGVKPHG